MRTVAVGVEFVEVDLPVHIVDFLLRHLLRFDGISTHPRFFDEQSGSAVAAIVYVRGVGNLLLTSILL